MPQTKAIVATPNASRYLQQLCKHFAHKVDVTFTPKLGAVSLPIGRCEFSADAAHLAMTGTSKATDLPRLEQFLGDHLARFAFRENPIIEWQRSA